jgi:heme-degrading monooxygenase HmoA
MPASLRPADRPVNRSRRAIREDGAMSGPVLEHAVFHIAPDDSAAFEEGFATARLVIGAAPGCRWVELHRGVERPGEYLLLVGWDTLDDHTAFRSSDAFPQWRAPIQPFFAAAPEMEHFTSVVARTP